MTATAAAFSPSLLPKSASARWSPGFYVDFTSRGSGWFTKALPPRSSLIVLEQGQAEVAAAAATGVSTPISSSPPSNVGGRVARSDGQVTQVGVVCSEQFNPYLRQFVYLRLE